MTSPQSLGHSLAAARKKAGLSQRELAERVHRSETCIANYEAGRREMRASFIRRAATALRCSPSEILEITGP